MRRPDRRSTQATSRAWRCAGASRSPRSRPSRGSSRRPRWPTPTPSMRRTCGATSSRSTGRRGALRWTRRYHAPNDGPNGLAVTSDGVYGATDSDAFRLDPDTGEERWRRHLTGASEQFVAIAPVVWEDLVFVSTLGFPPTGRGAIYALDAETGAVRWKFVTVKEPWTVSARGRRRWRVEPGLGRLAGSALRGQLEPGAVGRHAGAAERRDLPRARAVHRLAPRARRAHRAVALVRPGDPARRSGLRLPRDPDSRDARRSRRRVRRGQGRTRDRLGPRDAPSTLDHVRRAAPERRRSAASAQGDGLPGPARRRRDADGLRGRAGSSFRSWTSAAGGARSIARS